MHLVNLYRWTSGSWQVPWMRPLPNLQAGSRCRSRRYCHRMGLLPNLGAGGRSWAAAIGSAGETPSRASRRRTATATATALGADCWPTPAGTGCTAVRSAGTGRTGAPCGRAGGPCGGDPPKLAVRTSSRSARPRTCAGPAGGPGPAEWPAGVARVILLRGLVNGIPVSIQIAKLFASGTPRLLNGQLQFDYVLLLSVTRHGQ